MRFDSMDDPGAVPGDAAGLEAIIAELRREEAVRPEWRARLDRALVASRQQHRERQRDGARAGASAGAGSGARTWHIRPLTAVAAALTFTVLGALGSSTVASVLRARGEPATVATARAEPVMPTSTSGVGRPGTGVRFAVLAPGVKRVSLVGDFNGWDPAATPLTLSGDGRTWTVLLPLGHGRHTYAFVIDDEIVADPAAPRAIDDDFGTPSSFVLVDSRSTPGSTLP